MGELLEIRSVVSYYNICIIFIEYSKGGRGDGVELWLFLKFVV